MSWQEVTLGIGGLVVGSGLMLFGGPPGVAAGSSMLTLVARHLWERRAREKERR